MMALSCHHYSIADNISESLGIPGLGSVETVTEKLTDKGWTMQNDGIRTRFAGKLNGRNMYLYLFDKEGEVYRIMAWDGTPVCEDEAKTLFNSWIDTMEEEKSMEGHVRNRYIGTEDSLNEMELMNENGMKALFLTHDDENNTGKALIKLHNCGPELWIVTLSFNKD